MIMLNENARHLFEFWFQKGVLEAGVWNDGVRFFYLYLCLNIIMANLSEEDRDRQMLDWIVANDNPLKSAFERRLEYRPFTDQLERLRSMCPVGDSRPNSQRQVNITEATNFQEVLNVIYQIRCNFFHGNKPTSIQRNQMLIETSTYILKYWLEAIYNRP